MPVQQWHTIPNIFGFILILINTINIHSELVWLGGLMRLVYVRKCQGFWRFIFLFWLCLSLGMSTNVNIFEGTGN